MNFDTYVEIQQQTEFEKGKGSETFIYIIVDGKAFLHGYHINSMDLIVN